MAIIRLGDKALMPLGRLVHVATLVASYWYWQTQHLADFHATVCPRFSVEVGESEDI